MCILHTYGGYRESRAHQCLLCDYYQEGKRYAIPNIYNQHILLDSALLFCSRCHFITTEKKLQDNVTHTTKHTQAAKNMADHGRSYLHENKNPLLLGEGSHFARIGWKYAHDVWASRIRPATLIFCLKSPTVLMLHWSPIPLLSQPRIC